MNWKFAVSNLDKVLSNIIRENINIIKFAMIYISLESLTSFFLYLFHPVLMFFNEYLPSSVSFLMDATLILCGIAWLKSIWRKLLLAERTICWFSYKQMASSQVIIKFEIIITLHNWWNLKNSLILILSVVLQHSFAYENFTESLRMIYACIPW